jgi:hypothetical protein
VIGLRAVPETISLGSPTTFWGNVTGGSGPLTLNFSGLPCGCAVTGPLPTTCTPGETGAFSVSLNVTDPEGVGAFATASLTVQAVAVQPLTVGSFTIVPATITISGSVFVRLTIDGGQPPVSVSYGDVPAGCDGSGRFEFNCTLDQVGIYNVSARVRDAAGVESSGNTSLMVLPHAPVPGHGSGSDGSSFPWLEAAIVAVVAAVLTVTLFVLWGRRQP